MTRNQTIASLFAFAVTSLALQTAPGLAFTSEAQQMCSGDAMRLCSSEIQVSPGCRAVMDREHAAAAASRKREASAR